MPIEWDKEQPVEDKPQAPIVWDKEPQVSPQAKPQMIEKTFAMKNPNLHAGLMTPVGVGKELSKISYLKYVYPEERKKLRDLSMQTSEEGWTKGSNLGTRRLLFDALEAVTIGAFKPITQGSKQILKHYLPKTYGVLFETPIGQLGKKGVEGGQTVAQKIFEHRKRHNGAPPPQKTLNKWVKEANKKRVPTPADEKLPKYAQSVNLEKQNIPIEAKKLELQMAGKKKTQTWDETGMLSDDIIKYPAKTDAAFKKIQGLEGLTENMEAVRKVNADQINNLAKLAEQLEMGVITEDAFNAAFNTAKENFFKVASEGSGEIGRALNAHKKIIGATDYFVKGLAKMEKNMTPQQRKAFVDAVKSNNPAKVAEFMGGIDNPKLKDYVLEYWYNSILSGPPTHAVNIISNTAWAAYQVPHRVHSILWDKIYSTATGKQKERFFREIIPSLAGLKAGFKRGAKGAYETVRTGKLQEFETKWAQEMGLSSVGAWGRSPSKFMRKVAPVLSAPTRALRAMDVWANSIAYDSEMMAIANRIGIKKGLQKDGLKAFVQRFVKNPTDEAHGQAMKFAKHNTFMDDPDKFTAWILKSRKIPVVGPASQVVIPFVNTIGNLTKRGLELTPGVGIAKEAISRGMGRGMPNSQVIAKQIEGSVLSLYLMYKLDAGEVTGEAPRNAVERERFYAQGKQPWAIRFGDTWVSYRRMEPYNTVFASVATAYENIKNAKDDETKTRIFGKIAGDMKSNLLDSSYFQGLQQVFNRHQKLEEAPQRTAATLIPYSSFWRSMNRAYEKHTEGNAKVRKQGTWLSAFAQVIPGLSGKVPAKLNIWGDEIVLPGSVLQHWLPYKWSKETQDPVEIELERLNKALKDSPTGLRVFPGQPNQTIRYRGEKIKLSDKVYRDYLIDLGMNLRSSYDKTIASRKYMMRSDEKKAKMLIKRTEKARKRIRVKLLRKLKHKM